MIKIPMSAAGSGLVRALLARAGVSREQVRLVAYRATDWRSLTFTGERHELTLRIPGEDRATIARRLLDGLDEHEFTLTGQIVADLASNMTATTDREPAIEVRVEALTVEA